MSAIKATRDAFKYDDSLSSLGEDEAENCQVESAKWSCKNCFNPSDESLLSYFPYRFEEQFCNWWLKHKEDITARFYLRSVHLRLPSYIPKVLSQHCPFTERWLTTRTVRLVLVCSQITNRQGRWIPLAHIDDIEVPHRLGGWLSFKLDEKEALFVKYARTFQFHVVESNGLYSRRLTPPYQCQLILNVNFDLKLTKASNGE